MSWLCGYIFTGGLLSVLMTLAYTMAEYVIGKLNIILLHYNTPSQLTTYIPFIAIANVLNVQQTDNQGAIVGLYILFLIIGVGYSYLGIKFSGYLNYFMSMHSTTIVLYTERILRSFIFY